MTVVSTPRSRPLKFREDPYSVAVASRHSHTKRPSRPQMRKSSEAALAVVMLLLLAGMVWLGVHA